MEQITAGAISIFMSGDGQSIPFGCNWVSKIEGKRSISECLISY